MKLLINTSNLYVGGGLQVALSFINELKNFESNNQYYIFLSSSVNDQLIQDDFPENFKFYLIKRSPSSIRYRKKVVEFLDALEKDINPDIVFSIFGPSYWRPKTRHIMGFALPWLINEKSDVFSELSFFKRLIKKLEIKYKGYHVKNNADYYVTETEEVRQSFSRIYNVSLENIFVVGNTCSSIFDQKEFEPFYIPSREIREFRLITISHNYPHKNLRVIRNVLPYLKNNNVKFKFILTIDEESYDDLFSGYENYVMNIGPIKSEFCPSAYAQSDALFLPTLLECFTASYPEAMKMNKPILTSSLPFAVDICKDAALFFDPLDPKDIADKILMLSAADDLRKSLAEKGEARLKEFESAESRSRKYIGICNELTYRNP